MTEAQRLQMERAIEHVVSRGLMLQIGKYPDWSTTYSAMAAFAAVGRLDLAIKEAELLPDLWARDLFRWWETFREDGTI